MADQFPIGARVRIGQCEGTVKGHNGRVVVQFDGVGYPGYFDPKFVHPVEPPSDANQAAVGPVVDTELQHKIVRSLWDAADICLSDAQLTTMTDAVIADVVAPVLAERDAEIDRLHLDIQGYQVGGGYERGHEHGSAVAAKLRAELQRATDLVDELRKHITSRDKATELRLAEIRRLRAERDELRAHGVARDIGEANEQMRAELEALKAGTRLVWLPEFGDDEEIQLGEPTVHNHADGRFLLRGGQPDTEATTEQDEPKKRAETTCASGPTAENPATTPRGVTPAPTTSPREPWRTTTGAATALATQSPTDPTEHAAATPTEPRAVYHDPGNVEHEYDEDEKPINPSVGWDIAWGCRVSFSHYDGAWRVTVSVSDAEKRNGGSIRTVTREQLRKLAHQLIELTEVVETTPSGIPDSISTSSDPIASGTAGDSRDVP